MMPVVNPDLVALKARGIHRIHDGAGSLIECLSGVLWITQHGDHRDITLVPGERFRLDRDGLSIVYGLKPSRFRLSPRQAPAGQPSPPPHVRAA